MRRTIEAYLIVPINGGEVVCFQRGHRKEYLGADGLWRRTPKHCDAFTGEGEAAAKLGQLQEEDERR